MCFSFFESKSCHKVVGIIHRSLYRGSFVKLASYFRSCFKLGLGATIQFRIKIRFSFIESKSCNKVVGTIHRSLYRGRFVKIASYFSFVVQIRVRSNDLNFGSIFFFQLSKVNRVMKW